MQFLSWEQALLACSQPGIINAILAVLISVFIEYVPGFGQLESRWKVIIFFAISAMLPVAAAALGIWTLGWPVGWETTWWPALQAGMLAWMSGSGAHLFQKKANAQ
jgi:hypothetical protein